ncbi:S-adenosyl-L-methionine-dependent methyltransferase [Trametes cingulata]|nr:S-adenosyl-L-methionine-dependent methyltransferase [Trametes cingulata]
MSKARRPNAWDVSFPAEAAGPSAAVNSRGSESTSDGSKRKPSGSAIGSPQPLPEKRPKLLSKEDQRQGGPSGPKRSYISRPEDVREDADTVVFDEDSLERDEGASDEKPVRLLADFTIFDPRGYELVSLGLLDSDTHSYHFEAAGFVAPVFLNKEDEGQEDGVDTEDDHKRHLQRLQTSAIFAYTIDYTKTDGPSWYELCTPSQLYRSTYHQFYRPHRLAQVIIATAIATPTMSFTEFSATTVGSWDDALAEHLQEHDFHDVMHLVQAALEDYDEDNRQTVLSTPFIQHFLSHPSSSYRHPSAMHHRPTHAPRPHLTTSAALSGNIDLAVLRADAQNPTHVSPLIDNLAMGLFHEHLQVVGPPPKHASQGMLKQRNNAMLAEVLRVINRAREPEANISVHFPYDGQLDGQYWRVVTIDDITYEVGECIVVEAQEYGSRIKPEFPQDPLDLPSNIHLADFCWFAKIQHINQQTQCFHVQWYEHGSQTFLQEVCDPQELFLWPTCSEVCVKNALRKVTVHSTPPNNRDLGPMEYYCWFVPLLRFVYNETDASFTDIDQKAAATANSLPPPDNCMSCHLHAQQADKNICRAVKGGLSYGGHVYQPHDYVLYKTEEGPAGLARINKIQFPKAARASGSATLHLTLLGRVAVLLGSHVLSFNTTKLLHEREVVMTEETQQLDAQLLLNRCIVAHHDDVTDLEAWLALSPFHFVLRYHLPTLDASWSQRIHLRRRMVLACQQCLDLDNTLFEELDSFITGGQGYLRTFDPFAGVGAFALAMEELHCVKLTHAVEITPSAALTLKENSPSTVVYNQCSNLVFKHAVKSYARKLASSDQLHSLHDNTPLTKPPVPEEIDCIITGFPCQPHSHLNMFRKANDRKSHLLLNLLSWVDFLRPKHCIFENVRGFFSYNLHARQAGRYRVEGGIAMGGVKFLVYALLTMGYQVRFGLLQAAHYGTPQSRVRFFLFAAQQGYPLPQLPQPTHDFPQQDALQVKLPNGTVIKPILTANGTAPMKFISVAEAIGDLPEFDWKDPGKIIQAAPQRADVLTLECDPAQKSCGLRGPCPSASLSYRFEKPRTSFQAKCRAQATSDLQHFTRALPADTVERVVKLPLEPEADYRKLDARLREWQNANPASALARDGFRRGLYGRLDKDKWFHTTVTNVEPTAKQSYVIHPWCKRVLTVRELARSQGFPDWFVFHAIDDNVKTLQRHIGNAVPWPVSEALGRELRAAMLKKWLQDREDAIEIEDSSE